MMKLVRGALVAIAVIGAAQFAAANDEPARDAAMLLREIHKSRAALANVRIIGRVTITPQGLPAEPADFVLDVGTRSRYRVKLIRTDRTERVIFDGKQLLAFDGRESATVTSPENPPPSFGFDPRLLGLTAIYRPDVTLVGELGHNSKDVSVIKSADGDPEGYRHLQVIDKFRQQLDFWVDPATDCRLARSRVTISEGDQTIFQYETTSTFEREFSAKWLPSQVETVLKAGNQELLRYAFIIVDMTPDEEFDDEEFSLQGLGLPVGVPVVDLRIKQRLGYWNGVGLSKNLP